MVFHKDSNRRPIDYKSRVLIQKDKYNKRKLKVISNLDTHRRQCENVYYEEAITNSYTNDKFSIFDQG